MVKGWRILTFMLDCERPPAICRMRRAEPDAVESKEKTHQFTMITNSFITAHTNHNKYPHGSSLPGPINIGFFFFFTCFRIVSAVPSLMKSSLLCSCLLLCYLLYYFGRLSVLVLCSHEIIHCRLTGCLFVCSERSHNDTSHAQAQTHTVKVEQEQSTRKGSRVRSWKAE